MSNTARNTLKTNLIRFIELLVDIPEEHDKIGWAVWLGTFLQAMDSMRNGFDFLRKQYGSYYNE